MAYHFVKCKEESQFSKVTSAEESENYFKQKKFVYSDALRMCEAAVAVATVYGSIPPLLPHVFLMPFSQLSQYSGPVLPSLAAILKRIAHISFFGSYHFLINYNVQFLLMNLALLWTRIPTALLLCITVL